VLPPHLLALLGPEPFLETLCPEAPPSASRVLRIQSATPSALAGSPSVRSSGPLALVRGGLLYAVDALDAAHALFQDDESPLASYWHGMMHRREGDFANAQYWFRLASPILAPLDLLDFHPETFTRRCAAARSRPDFRELPALLEAQRYEWETLLQFSLQAALE
jgi:hypothetical protein